MRVGVLGSGLMGGKLGTLFARAGHEVVFSFARSGRKLTRLARQAKGRARAGTVREAAQHADALVLAVHWSRIGDILGQTGDLSGKVLITCSLPMNDDDTELVVVGTSSGAEELARMVPQARVVSAFNTVPSEVLFGVYQARRRASRPSLARRISGPPAPAVSRPRRPRSCRGRCPLPGRTPTTTMSRPRRPRSSR